MKTEGRYVNTGDLTVPANTGTFVKIQVADPRPSLMGWQLGISTDYADTPSPGIRVSVQLHVGETPEIIGQFLYYSPGRPLQGEPLFLPYPYMLEEGESLYLFMKVRNSTDSDVTVRSNVYLYFAVE